MANEAHVRAFACGVEAWNHARQRKPATKPDLSGTDLANLYFQDPEHQGLRSLYEPDALLKEFGLPSTKSAVFRLLEYDFTDTNLSRTNLHLACLSGGKLARCNLSGADLSDATLKWADLVGADLSSANCRGADFTLAQLRDVNFSGTDLRGANLSIQEDFTREQAATAITDNTTQLPSHWDF